MVSRKRSPLGTAARGYGTEHQRLRALWAPRVTAGMVPCWRCRGTILPGLQADTKTQITRTRNTITLKHQEIGALELHEYQLVTTIDGRERKIDRLLDEWLAMRGAEALAEALVDEDGQPAQALPHVRLI